MLSLCIIGLVGLLSAGLTSASPTRVNPHLLTPLNEVAVRDPLEIARNPHIEKRISADFSLDHEWHNEVLFDGKWTESGEHDAQAVSLSVVCRECWTKGTVTAKLTTQDIIKPVVRLDLGGVEAYVDLDVDVSASAVYAINLFTSNSPVGIGFPGLSVGLVFYVDLVFSASAVLDLEGGFYVSLEDDAFLETDVFSGDITDSLFDGIGTKSFPITVNTGSATFKAALRLRVQLGAETEVPLIGVGLGGGAVVGIYANIVEFVAELDSTPDCALETRQWFNLNVGAYARAGFDLDFTTIGVAPTISTTLFDSPTFTQCWIDGKPASSGFGGGDPTPTISVSAVTSPAELPSPPMLAEPVLPVTETVVDSSSLVVATTLTTPGQPTLVTQSRLIETPVASNGWPRGNSSSTLAEPDLVTTTIYPTTEYVITSCAASVINCPASLEKKIVVTKTLDAYTTVCPPGASVTVPPQRGSASVDVAEVAVVHVITEVVHLHKLKKPAVHTFHETPSEKPTAQRLTVADVVSASSAASETTTDSVKSVVPLVSELPVAVQEEDLSHNATTPHSSEPTQSEAPAVPTDMPASGSKYQGFGSSHLLAVIVVAIGLA